MTLTFAGLIRAHGEEGTGGTTIDPENTYVTTNSGTTTTFDLEGTYYTTIGNTTTFDLEETYETTTYQGTTTPDPEETIETTHLTTSRPYDINAVELQAPTGTSLSFDANGYAQSGPSGTFFPITDLSFNSNWYGFYKLKATMEPKTLSPHPGKVTINLEVEIWVYNGVSPISRQSHEYELECDCDPANGNLNPTGNFILLPISSTSYQWSEVVNGIPVAAAVKAELGPVSLSGSGTNLVTLTGDFGIELTKNGNDTKVNPKKTFKLEVRSHQHP